MGNVQRYSRKCIQRKRILYPNCGLVLGKAFDCRGKFGSSITESDLHFNIVGRTLQRGHNLSRSPRIPRFQRSGPTVRELQNPDQGRRAAGTEFCRAILSDPVRMWDWVQRRLCHRRIHRQGLRVPTRRRSEHVSQPQILAELKWTPNLGPAVKV